VPGLFTLEWTHRAKREQLDTDGASTGDLPSVKLTRTTARRRECEQSTTTTVMN